jgi:hypothetical protein
MKIREDLEKLTFAQLQEALAYSNSEISYLYAAIEELNSRLNDEEEYAMEIAQQMDLHIEQMEQLESDES